MSEAVAIETQDEIGTKEWYTKEECDAAIAEAVEHTENRMKLEKEQAVKYAWDDAKLSARADYFILKTSWIELLKEVRSWKESTTQARQLYRGDVLKLDFTEAQETAIKTQINVLAGVESWMKDKMKELDITE